MIEAGQGREALPRNRRCVRHGDQGVGVGRVAGYSDTDVVGGDLTKRLALRGEDRAVGLQQVPAFHTGAARAGADQQGQVHAIKDLGRVGTDLHAGQRPERAVIEFHDHTLECLEGGFDLE